MIAFVNQVGRESCHAVQVTVTACREQEVILRETVDHKTKQNLKFPFFDQIVKIMKNPENLII